MDEILILTPSGQPCGGSEVMLGRFLGSAARHGISCHTIFLEGGEHFREIASRGVSCELIESHRLRQPVAWWRCSQRLKARLIERRPAMVIGWQAKCVAYMGGAARTTGVPFVCFHRGVPSGHYIDRLSYALPCEGYLANSDFTARRLRHFTRRPIEVIHSAVDLTEFHPSDAPSQKEWKALLGFDSSRPLVGIVARLQEWKGIHHFVDAFQNILRRQPECQGVIVGGDHGMEPEYARGLEETIRRLRLPIRFCGSQKDVPSWMKAMDVVVHASRNEPFGLVVIEAMSLGKPVIASIPGGPGEVIRHGENGQLVPWGDTAAIADAVLKYLENPEFSRACGREAVKTAAQFDDHDYAPRVCDAARSVIQESRGAIPGMASH